jgi:hypothetical protein
MNDPQPKPASREVLDPHTRAKVLALVSLGCSRRMAAEKVHCAHTTIGRAAARDPQFAAALAEAEARPDREDGGLLRQARRRRRKAKGTREKEDRPARGFRGNEVVDMLLGMFLSVRPPVRPKDVLNFLSRLRDVLVREEVDVPQACPNCRRHARLFAALKSLSVNSLHQQKGCAPLDSLPRGGAHRDQTMHQKSANS